MTHLATADCDLDFARAQVERFRAATEPLAHLTRHVANSAAALRLPSRASTPRAAASRSTASRLSARTGRPTGSSRCSRGTSEIAQARSSLAPGESTGYGRRFVAERDTWIGIMPVGYADGFRRDLTGTEVLVEGERRRVVGTVSMDAFAVELDRELPPGTPVTLVGAGVPLEAHARVAGTIAYELASRIESTPTRARRSRRL